MGRQHAVTFRIQARSTGRRFAGLGIGYCYDTDMRIVFMGSPEFALPTLRALAASDHEIVAVVTQPDRPAGRHHTFTPPAVKAEAINLGLAVLQPEKIGAPAAVDALRKLEPDVLVVAAFGQILSRAVLETPRRGSLNVHTSLLPKYRGASPVAAAILNGETVTGVTIMEIVRALDAGAIVAQVEEPVSPHDTTATLEARLAEAGARLLMQVLDDWAERRLEARPQDEAAASYAPLLKRADALVDWNKSAERLWREVRAFNPWPVAFTRWRGSELKLWQAWPLEGNSGSEPGTVLGTQRLPEDAGGAEGLVVQTGDGRLALVQVQLQGKKAVAAPDFVRGQRDITGARLGT